MEEKEIIEEVKNESKVKKFFKFFLIFLTLIIVGFYLYIHYIEPKIIRVNEQAVIDSDLPNEFNGFKIVHFSDIHYGSTINDKELDLIVKKINQLHPDIIVYTGDLLDDFINLKDDSYEKIKTSLKNLEARTMKYAVIGNSDYINKEKYLEIMNNSGFKVLENESDLIYYKGNTPIEFIGTSSILDQENDINKASEIDIDDSLFFKIWLNHEPVIMDMLIEQDLHPNLLLTGHTLGGLINIPFYGYLLKQDGIEKYTDDYYHKKKINMYVSNGLGTYKYSIRLGNIPSINFYRLYNH